MNKEEEKEYYFDNMDDYVYNEYFDDGPGEKEYYFGSILEYADVVYKLIPENKSDTTLMTYFTEHHKNPLTEPKIITFIKSFNQRVKHQDEKELRNALKHFCKIVKDKNTKFYTEHKPIIDVFLKE